MEALIIYPLGTLILAYSLYITLNPIPTTGWDAPQTQKTTKCTTSSNSQSS